MTGCRSEPWPIRDVPQGHRSRGEKRGWWSSKKDSAFIRSCLFYSLRWDQYRLNIQYMGLKQQANKKELVTGVKAALWNVELTSPVERSILMLRHIFNNNNKCWYNWHIAVTVIWSCVIGTPKVISLWQCICIYSATLPSQLNVLSSLVSLNTEQTSKLLSCLHFMFNRLFFSF